MGTGPLVTHYLKDLPDHLSEEMYRAILAGLCGNQWLECSIADTQGNILLQMRSGALLNPNGLRIQDVTIEVVALDQKAGQVAVQLCDGSIRGAATKAANLIAHSVQHRLERLYHEERVAQLAAIMDERHLLSLITENTAKTIDQGAYRSCWQSIAAFLDKINDALGLRKSLLLVQKSIPSENHFKVRAISRSATNLRHRSYVLNPVQLKAKIGNVKIDSAVDVFGVDMDRLLEDLFDIPFQNASLLVIPTTTARDRLAVVLFFGDKGPKVKTGLRLEEYTDLLTAAVAQISLSFSIRQRRYEADHRSKEALMDRARYVHIATHQLRGPLAGIKFYCEALTDRRISDEKKVNYTRYLQAMVRMWSGFIQNLAWASQRNTDIFGDDLSVRFQSQNINRILVEVAIALQPFAEMEKGSRISVENSQPSVIYAEISDNHFRQAVLNLLHNAVKYCDPLTEISVRLHLAGDYVTISFVNQGIRIPPGSEQKIFEREYRTEEAKEKAPEGTGLGLFIVKEVMQLHGGDVLVGCEEIAPRKYRTTFTLELPRKHIARQLS